MIPQSFEYDSPSTLDEALNQLASGDAKVLAGGMSLIPMMKLRLSTPEKLIDLSRIPDLSGIQAAGGKLHIGALTTHFEVESSSAVRAQCPLLAQTASHIGDVQVRNMGTLGGSLAHADPAADYPAALCALEAQVRIVGAKTDRTVSIEDFLIDVFTTTLEPGEIIREIIVPVEASGAGTSYKKMLQPASGFAIVGVAARMQKSAGKIAMARIGVTGVGSKAYRARNVEALLEGQDSTEATIAKAAAVVAEGIDANSDIHASAAYRRQMAAVYAARAIRAALAVA